MQVIQLSNFVSCVISVDLFNVGILVSCTEYIYALFNAYFFLTRSDISQTIINHPEVTGGLHVELMSNNNSISYAGRIKS